jgi:hypothetical protein
VSVDAQNPFVEKQVLQRDVCEITRKYRTETRFAGLFVFAHPYEPTVEEHKAVCKIEYTYLLIIVQVSWYTYIMVVSFYAFLYESSLMRFGLLKSNYSRQFMQ